MRRREFIALLGGAVAWPFAAPAQQPDKPIIGYLSSRSASAERPLQTAFLQGLQGLGFVQGETVTVEYRFSQGQNDRLPALAADLVRRGPAVLVATSNDSGLAAKGASTTIPIVFATGSDPVGLGLAEALNRPGGNATGVYVFVSDLGPKRLQLLRETVPHAKTIAFIVNLNGASGPPQKSEMERTAEAIGQQMLIVPVSTESEIDEAFATIVDRKVDAILYSTSTFFQVVQERLVTLAARHSIPAIYEWPEFVMAGGLMSYSSSRSEALRQLGNYTGQILKGAKPADLPIVQSSKFELVINLKTAKALGLEIPPTVLARADEVIE